MDNYCRRCKYHEHMAEDDFMCENENSENYGDITSYDDCCEEFEERDEHEEYLKQREERGGN